MEDFGYKKDEERSAFSELTKRSFLIGATLFSIACFVYVTISAYYFVYQEKDGDVEVIKAEEGPIKVFEEKVVEDGASMQIDRTIYEDIFGNKDRHKGDSGNTKIRKAPEPALPPKVAEEDKEEDKRLIKESEVAVEQNTAPKSEEKRREQKIVVYSDAAKKEAASKDLLTNVSGEERVSKSSNKPSVKSQKRAIRVQIAAMTSKSTANDAWDKLSRLHPNLFSGLKPFVIEANLGKRGVFYRLQIGNFFNQVEAEEFCSKYVVQSKKSRGDCIVVE